MHLVRVGAKLPPMQPLVLALIDSVLALAFHHHERAARGSMSDYESAAVHATVSGPEFGEPCTRGLEVRVSVTLVPRSEEREVSEDEIRFQVDFDGERLLASELALAELPLDRSGLARLIGELEAWCYARIPIQQLGELEDAVDQTSD